VVKAQLFAPPDAIFCTPLVSPETLTGTLLPVPIAPPLPNWPEPCWPQHLTPPPVVNAHVWFSPAAMAWTPLDCLSSEHLAQIAA
jgi:hypothetical protein